MHTSIRIVYDSNAPEENKYTVIPSSAPLKAAIDAIRNWSNCAQLVEFAIARHGYSNTDSMSGVIYPNDLDEFDRLTDQIPARNVEVYAWYGEFTGPCYAIREKQYLLLLREYLLLHQEYEHVSSIEALLQQVNIE